MRYIKSDVEKTLKDEKKMVFIAGPRQVGKTTLVKALLKEASSEKGYFNWDIAPIRRKIIRDPLDFWRPSDGSPPARIGLDEIHKFPRWKKLLKGFFDAYRDEVEVLVSGSGRLDIYQRGGDSLFGRYHLYHLFPYSLREFAQKEKNHLSPEDTIKKVFEAPNLSIREAFNLFLQFNGFPEPLFSANMRFLIRWRNDHRQLILREEMRDLTQIRELGLVETLIELLPERIGSPISINALREDIEVNFKTVQNWLSVLDRLYYLFSIPPFSKRLARSLKKEKKVYFYDWSELEDAGKRFENMTAVHLYRACYYWTDAGYGDFRLYYVRDKEKREVDFLICESNKPFMLIEAKLSDKQIDPSLLYFKERLQPKYAFQLVGNEHNLLISKRQEGINLCAASRFLSALP